MAHNEDSTPEGVVQEEKKEHQKYNLSLYLKGKMFRDCVVDTRFDGNVITSAACYEAGFTPPTDDDEEEDDESVIVACLEGVCVQIVGSKEQYSLDFTIVNLPRETHLVPMQLGKKWVDSLIGPNSPNLHTQGEG